MIEYLRLNIEYLSEAAHAYYANILNWVEYENSSTNDQLTITQLTIPKYSIFNFTY